MPTTLILISGMDVTEPVGGGHRPYVRAFARAATVLGFDVHIFAVSRRPRTQVTNYGTVHCTAPAFVPLRGSLTVFHAYPLASSIVEFARSKPGPHLLHGFGRWGYAGMLASRRLARHGMATTRVQSSYTVYAEEARSKLEGARAYASPGKWLRYWRDYWEDRLCFSWQEGALHRQADLVLVNYRSVERLLQAYFGASLSCRIIPYTIESAFTEMPVGRAEDASCVDSKTEEAHVPRILSISRQDPRKGIDILLRALALLQKRGVIFKATLAGSGPMLEVNRALVAQLGLNGCVTMPGYVDVALLEELHQRHDIFVLPSLAEHSGSVALLEAMYAGMACVASACDGIPEDIVNGDNGQLVAPGDPVALADALQQVLVHPGQRRHLAQQARKSFDSRFGPAVFTSCLREIYSELGFMP